MEYKFRSTVFSDFAAFSNLLNKYFDQTSDSQKEDHLEVEKMLKHIHFHPQEWETRAVQCSANEYTRTLVAYGHNYSMHLLCWKAQQENVIHNHNQSYSFFKVLAGTLSEAIYYPPEDGKPMKIKNKQKWKPFDVVRHSPEVIHQVSNKDNHEIAYSLHIYSPPLKQCNSFCPNTGNVEVYDCAHHLHKSRK